MPELPEVETIRRDLNKKIINKPIIDILVSAKARVFPNRKKFVELLKNNKIIKTDRVGKLLILVLKDKLFLLIHLKMTGQLIFQWKLPPPLSLPLGQGEKIEMIGGGHSDKEIPQILPDRFTRVVLDFGSSGKLFFNDMRRFGYMKIVNADDLKREKTKYGIEPLQPNFTLENFKKVLQNKKTSIKAVLLNQKFIAGVGNIYADESCFLAGVRPDKKASNLTLVETKKLYKAVEKVIKKSIEERGTTFNHYRDSDGKKGNFVKFLKVYGRGGEKCRKCGHILKKAKVAGRGTVFCENCQK